MNNRYLRAGKMLGFIAFSGLILSACSGSKKTTQTAPSRTPGVAAPGGAPNGAPARPGAARGGIKKYSDVITKEAKTDEGLFSVHKVGDKYYFEIPDELLEREILIVTRVSGSTENFSFGGAGQKARGQQVIRWQRNGDNILLRHVSYNSVASEEDPVSISVRNNNFEPVIQSMGIEAIGKDSNSVVIDVTSLYNGDVRLLSGLSEGQRRQFQVRRLDPSRTFINHMNSYPKNIEVRVVQTFDVGAPPADEQTGTLSVEVNHSMILLPEEPMVPRIQDNRVGFFAISQYDYGLDEHKATQRTYITRWKLVPKDKAAYLRGELVEPVEPIVYYIDPGTPLKWREALKQGVEDWQVAFEAAGFKNAIIAKDPPTKEEDPEFSPEDVRYSVIRYITNPIQNAQGPHVHDPRTGQILESDILWYHNVMNLLRNWFFIQTAAANPEARSVKYRDDIMHELVRFVAAHEVGHTLGFPHNWGNSYGYPVDSLRSPTFTATHGTAPSIMDYARFNYIAQPGDGVTNFYPRVGEYDKWVTKWGYTWFPDVDDPTDESERLHAWVKERAGNPLYFYGRQGPSIDPRSQSEDLGNDAVKASELGLANLQVITENLISWIEADGENFDDLSELYGNIIGQWNRYMGHVRNNIAGIYENFKTFDQEGAVFTPVDRETQKRSVDFLLKHGLSSPTWAFNDDILSRINQATAVETFRGAQAGIINNVLSPQRLGRLIDYERRVKGTYTAVELLDDFRKGIWSELSRNRSIDVHRRAVQRAHIERLGTLMADQPQGGGGPGGFGGGGGGINVSQSDIRPLVREQLEILQRDIKRAAQNAPDRMTRIHLREADSRIENILNPK